MLRDIVASGDELEATVLLSVLLVLCCTFYDVKGAADNFFNL